MLHVQAQLTAWQEPATPLCPVQELRTVASMAPVCSNSKMIVVISLMAVDAHVNTANHLE